MLMNLVSIGNTVSRRHNLQNLLNALQILPSHWSSGDIALRRFKCAAHDALPVTPMKTVSGGFCDEFSPEFLLSSSSR